ncbi:hypothetical protein LCGC14_3102150 [marine sediment metagenome]|uniref:SpoVT-AbrB domain-containing protein n=1 Tax=marine sediment metagenome TaxID=412755 RepID=A0A0F8W7F0_9ZZZZ
MVDDKVVKVTTAGNRLAILLPPEMVKALDWEKGTVVQLHEDSNTLTARKLRQMEP